MLGVVKSFKESGVPLIATESQGRSVDGCELERILVEPGHATVTIVVRMPVWERRPEPHFMAGDPLLGAPRADEPARTRSCGA